MRTTVENLEPFILECRDLIKLIVGHLMAVKGGESARLREALHEARALTDLARRANFGKVVQLSTNMECIMEAAESDGPDRLGESLEVLCDMCAHIVLYVDSVLLYADTVAMVIEYPWMRDALTRRLSNYMPQGMLRNGGETSSRRSSALDGGPVVQIQDTDEALAAEMMEELQRMMEPEARNSDLVVDMSRVDELPLWLLGTLMSYHVALKRQGHQVRLTGIRPEARAGRVLRRLSQRFDGTFEEAMPA